MTAFLTRPTHLFALLLVAVLVSQPLLAQTPQLQDVDFQRTAQGHGRLLLDFSAEPQLPDIEQTETGLTLRFVGTLIKPELINLYSTLDFATQVSQIRLDQRGRIAEIQLGIDGAFSHLITRRDQQLWVDIAPPSANAQQQDDSTTNRRFQYTGDEISLNYQDIPIRQLLGVMADFLDLNLVASDQVQGNITLSLNQVPSDQALDIILTSQGLASRQQGKVLLVAPTASLVELEEQQRQANQSAATVAPLEDAFIKVNYANAVDLRTFIMDEQPATGQSSPSLAAGLMGSLPQLLPSPDNNSNANSSRFMSERGHLLVDERTNTLYVRDTAEQVQRIRDIVRTLDVPVDQVMIEARIVIARSGVSDELGVSWGVRGTPESARGTGAFVTERSTELGRVTNESVLSGNRGLSVDFNPSVGASFGFIANNLLLDLELAALETENRSEIISQPKVITSDRNKAVIRSGEEIPYTSIDEDGVRTTNFRQAELRLEVTPQIVGDGRIFLTLQVNNDSKGEETQNAGPTINTNAVETQVLVSNGETIVIGGIFTSQELNAEFKTPLLGDIPLLGALFRRSISTQEKVELLVFITPRLINNTLATN